MPRLSVGVASMVAVVALTISADAACTLDKGPERTVARAMAPDTLQLDDGTTVRLANLLSPHASDNSLTPQEHDSQIRARQALERLAVGKAIRLRFDSARKDRYGVTRAHVMLLDAEREIWLQHILLAEGHARFEGRLGERACVGELLAAEDTARGGALGLWTNSLYRVREARQPRDLALYRGTFQIITGVVTSVETARDLTRLILGGDRRRAASVSFRSNDRDLLGGLGGDARTLIGETVEARGWLDQRPGSFGAPDIDVSLAGHVRRIAR
jgi:micrococcal nuclease